MEATAADFNAGLREMPPLSSTGAGDLQTVVAVLQNIVVQLGNIAQRIEAASAAFVAGFSVVSATFPQTTGTSTMTAGAGRAAQLPDAPDGYLEVNIPGVGLRKIPYYPA